MKIKLTPILLLLIGEAVITTILFFMKTQYINMCEPYTFLNPFGLHPTKELCVNLINNVPHQNFYLMVDIFVLTIVVYLIFKLIKFNNKKYNSMLKVSPIFILLILEIVVTFLLYFWRGCGSACSSNGFLNPFGSGSGNNICMALCDYSKLSPYFYLAFDITVITLVIFLLYRIIKKILKK